MIEDLNFSEVHVHTGLPKSQIIEQLRILKSIVAVFEKKKIKEMSLDTLLISIITIGCNLPGETGAQTDKRRLENEIERYPEYHH